MSDKAKKLRPSPQTSVDATALLKELEFPTEDGQVTDYADDPGRLTKFGVSSKSYPEVLREDFDILSAMKVYSDLLVSSRTLEIIHIRSDRELGYQHFQFAVHNGNVVAMTVLQACLRIEFPKLKMDGIWGPKTEKALEESENITRELLMTIQMGYYVGHTRHVNQHRKEGFANRATIHMDRALAKLNDNVELIGNMIDVAATRRHERMQKAHEYSERYFTSTTKKKGGEDDIT
jgi:hypothetical protein